MKIKGDSSLYALSAPPMHPDGRIRLIPYIERYLATKPNAGSYQVDDLFKPHDYENLHPSNECLMCQRLLYFNKVKKYHNMMVEDISVTTRVAFKMGHAIHGMVQHWFEDMVEEGILLEAKNECKIHDKQLKIQGSVDSILTLPDRGLPVSVEIKSIDKDMFADLQKPLPAHVMQKSMYIMVAERLGIKLQPYGILLYVAKGGNQPYKEFIVEPMDMGPTLNRWQGVLLAKENKSAKGLAFGCEVGDSKYKKCPARAFCRRAE